MATRKPKAVEAEATPLTVVEPAPAKKPRSTKAKTVEAADTPAVKRARKPKAEAAAATTPALTPEERYKQIAEAAYYIAEKRGFAPGNPSDDWLQAEAAVDGTSAA